MEKPADKPQPKPPKFLIAEAMTMNDFFKEKFKPDDALDERFLAAAYNNKFKARARAQAKRERKARQRLAGREPEVDQSGPTTEC